MKNLQKIFLPVVAGAMMLSSAVCYAKIVTKPIYLKDGEEFKVPASKKEKYIFKTVGVVESGKEESNPKPIKEIDYDTRTDDGVSVAVVAECISSGKAEESISVTDSHIECNYNDGAKVGTTVYPSSKNHKVKIMFTRVSKEDDPEELIKRLQKVVDENNKKVKVLDGQMDQELDTIATAFTTGTTGFGSL